MRQTLSELFSYLKNPVLEKDQNTDSVYRLQKFAYLLIISLLTGVLFIPVFALIEKAGLINMEEHAMEDMMKQFSKEIIFFLVVVVAPVFEELIFRAPLTLFKNPKSFKIAFYSIAILFGLVHLTNFNVTKSILLLAPILVAPQIFLGSYLGFIRVRFGLLWSIALHATYNGILIFMTLFANPVS